MQEEYSLKGHIHSTESFGTVDGPGVRFVVFFQGCPMRCLYCHNPDTWTPDGGTEMTVDEILKEYRRNEVFYRSGGITATGGEPLMQMPFLTALFTEAKKEGIHTCLDTSGIMYRPKNRKSTTGCFRRLISYCWILNTARKRSIRNLPPGARNTFWNLPVLWKKAEIPMIVRHVVVPGITDTPEHLLRLGRLIGGFRNLKGLEVLPYHTMGEVKYKKLGMEYPLAGLENLPPEKAKEARNIILEGIRQIRQRKSDIQ